MPIIVVNKNDNNGTQKSLAAGMTGATTGFLAGEAIQRIPKYNDANMLHRYGKNMGRALGGLAGAAGVYSILKKKKEQQPQLYLM